MKRTTHKSKYFCGNKISDYGIECGYLDYSTLAKSFDAVLVNDITKLFYSTINGEHNEPEQENGYIDNSDEINALLDQNETLINTRDNSDDDAQIEYINEQIEIIIEKIEELEREQDEQPEIYQYYIVSDSGAEIIKQYTNDPLYYLPVLDCYVWGVTHWGTSWDYVLTDCKLELEEDARQ
jgi:hypothetical protein